VRAKRHHQRMAAIGCFLLSVCGVWTADAGSASEDTTGETARKRPWMFVTAEKIDGLRSLEEVRAGIRHGYAAELWKQLVAKVDEELMLEPITTAERNRSFSLVATVANRITDAALVALVTGERRYADAALRQIDPLFDSAQWPEWADKRHIEAGLKADLRHGQLARALGVTYDWLHGFLTDEERRRFLEGLDRCAIEPFKAGVEAGEHWSRRRSNWMTCVLGGFGILGMALGPDHPDSAWIVELAQPRMEQYMSIFGPEGEFNESVQYSGSTMYVVEYFLAERYASGGKKDPLARFGLTEFCRWYMHCTVPPGRVLGFGDPAPAMPPVVSHLSAVASSQRDPMIQWFYRQYVDLALPTHSRRALELLWYDPTLPAQSPEGHMPLGRAYHHQAKIVTSRSSWDPESTTSVVYAKAAQEDYHGHADWGQVCIDGYGERLIIDLGSGAYPRSHKDRYYNYQQWGHNVLVFGENETGGIPIGKARRGETTHAEFDDLRGGAWTMDLSHAYGEGHRVVRHVVHLLPRVMVVLDEAELDVAQPISLRWHTITPTEPDHKGHFLVRGKKAALASRVHRLDGESVISHSRHEYRPPYDKDGYGNPCVQRHEPFVELKTEGNRCRVLSAFCVCGPDEPVPSWQIGDDGWSIDTPEGPVRVGVDEDRLVVENTTTKHAWKISLRPVE
jgi:heparinase II/III-like protein